LGKTYGIKARCYEERPWGTDWELKEHIVNLMGTCLELEGNIQGTRWEQRKNEQNEGTLSACFSLPIDCMYFWFPKLFVTIFGLG
jgi:hypothetical protein